MKKRGLFLVTGAVLLCLLLGVYFWMKKQNETEDATTETDEETEVLISVSEDEIKNLTFRIENNNVTWTKEEDGWSMSEDENFPVDNNSMTQLTSELSSISVNRTLEDVNNLDDYGLDDPVNVITIEKTDDSTEIITVGTKNPSTGDTYLCV